MQPTVRQAISSIHARYYEPITLNGLAAEVFTSPFHFSRVFSKATGVTPGRYLTAVRLFEAKRLLLTTSLTVSDVVCSVGYSSVGTFTTRFTRAVGMTPSRYRDPEVRELVLAVAPHFQRLPALEAMREARIACGAGRGGASITGRILFPVGTQPGNVLVGAFSERIPQCAPAAYTGMSGVRSTDYALRNLPAGRWTVIAVAQHPAHGTSPAGLTIGFADARATAPGVEQTPATIRMRPLQPTDPPIAITLASRAVRPATGGVLALPVAA
ncbi:MAG TPA: helix-turn-helix transcriptional regulator [Pseudonocardia sp.]|nr:helix-turn-helix transcriptional regulator [Pseudonocardia sp.]